MSATPKQAPHARTFWAPSAIRRLKAVRSERSTMEELRDRRALSVSEQRYHDHLVRREAELEAEILEETKATLAGQRH